MMEIRNIMNYLDEKFKRALKIQYKPVQDHMFIELEEGGEDVSIKPHKEFGYIFEHYGENEDLMYLTIDGFSAELGSSYTREVQEKYSEKYEVIPDAKKIVPIEGKAELWSWDTGLKDIELFKVHLKGESTCVGFMKNNKYYTPQYKDSSETTLAEARKELKEHFTL